MFETIGAINKMTDLVAIKHFFTKVNQPVSMQELKSLTVTDREELGPQARTELIAML